MSSSSRTAAPPPPNPDTPSPEADSGSKQGNLSSKRRPSRAGTRSVATLSPAQLERKRANDREAQRAIRQRTKEHIERLETRIRELEAPGAPTSEQLNAALRRNKELEDEVAYLRVELHKMQSSLGMPEASGNPVWDGMSRGASQPSSNVPMMTQPQISHSVMAPNSEPSRSDPYAYRPGTQWQGQSPFPATAPPKREMTPSTIGEHSPETGSTWNSERGRVPDHHSSSHQGEYPHMLGGPPPHNIPMRTGGHVIPYQTPPHENQPYHHLSSHGGQIQSGQSINQYTSVHGGHPQYLPHHQQPHGQQPHSQSQPQAQPAQSQSQQPPTRSPSVGPRQDQQQMFYGGGFPQG